MYALYDVTPDMINKDWSNVLLDFPDLVLTKSFAYLSLNVFNMNIPSVDNISSPFKGAVTLRISLDDLLALKPLTFNVFTTVPPVKPPVGGVKQGFEAPMEFGRGGLRGTRSALDQTSLYLGTHGDPDANGLHAGMIIYKWDESKTEVDAPKETSLGSWRGGPNMSSATVGPEGLDWLQRSDGRLTAAWNTGKVIGFGWSAAPGTESGTPFPRPHIRVAVIKLDDMSLIAQPHIYNDKVAFAYPAMAVTTEGELGLTCAYGGGDVFPTVGVGFLKADVRPENYRWQLAGVGSGDIGPTTSPDWGDYYWLCEDPTQNGAWMGVGFVSRALSPNRFDHRIEVLSARFHRSSGVPAKPLDTATPTTPAANQAPESPIASLERKVRSLEEKTETQARQIEALNQELNLLRRQRQ
jgi:hypothetical protein